MTNKRPIITTMGMVVQPITPCMVHDQLRNDDAYRWSRNHHDIDNMQLVLYAYQFDHSYDHALTMVNFNPQQSNNGEHKKIIICPNCNQPLWKNDQYGNGLCIDCNDEHLISTPQQSNNGKTK